MKFALCNLFLILSLASYSKDFPGYYISNSGDTIQCYFKFKDWSLTPDSVTISTRGNTTTLKPSEIAGFGIYNYGDYKSSEIEERHDSRIRFGTGSKIHNGSQRYYNIHGGLGASSGNHKIEFTYYTPGVLNSDWLFKIKMMGVYYSYTFLK